MMDLPPRSIAHALELVDAVRCNSPRMVAHTIRQAAEADGLEALVVTLAAMVDDSRTVGQLLAWCNDEAEVTAWRNALSEQECIEFRAAYARGLRDPEVVDGYREYEKRRVQRGRRKAARRLRQAEEVAA